MGGSALEIELADNDWIKSVFESVKGHPKETLACLAMVVALLLYIAGAGPWFALGIPAIIYLLYIGKDYMDNRHKERLAELKVRETEMTIGHKARAKAQRSLQRRRNGNAKHG